MDGKDRIIDELRALVAKLTAQVEEQAARIAELELALAKAQKDSSTSSKPPSSDITKPKPKKKLTYRFSFLTGRHYVCDAMTQPR